MFGSMLNIFKVPDLRRKLGITILLILVYRIGGHVPCPLVDAQALQKFSSGMGGGGRSMFDMVDMFAGGAFRRMTIFALGIMPYITASIVLQLLTVVWPRLEKIAKEGEAGRKKINQYTRYGTVLLAAFQSIGLAIFMLKSGLALTPDTAFGRSLFAFTIMVAITTGTCFIMWLGEKITEHGIGNGISLIIAVGIIADYRNSVVLGVFDAIKGVMAPAWLVIVFALYVAVTMIVILMQQATRKIPIQYARRIVGRRETQGGSNYLPLKINTAGVIPVIFSSSILMFPGIIANFFPTDWALSVFLGDMFQQGSTLHNLYNMLNLEKGGLLNLLKMGNMYNLLYAALTIFFCYFYTAITFNPVDTADNLKRVGAFIPGRRPGKNTSDYIDYVLTRITLVGATFLVAVALLPDVLSFSFGINYSFADLVGGTGLIIVAGVLLDLMKQIESQLLMRHYEGFKYRSRGGGAGLSGGLRGFRGGGIGGSRTLASPDRRGRR
ncbi:preprotein translocase subunit SecY [Candidatus Sumerlaeota bacterium]|nr:preprotein translocase subunit SecY [Candidatus Sumerlaeota bacterium]